MNTKILINLGLLLALSGCELWETRDYTREPDAYDRYLEENSAATPEDDFEGGLKADAEAGPRFSKTPAAPLYRPGDLAEINIPETAYAEAEIEVNFNGIPLPAFINKVYGDLLGESYTLDPGLQQAGDLVTLRAIGKQNLNQLAKMAAEVLDQYGVGISREGSIMRFFPRLDRGADRPPLLVTGNTLPDVPLSHRTIFQFVPLKVVRPANATNWLQRIFAGKSLEVFDDLERNSLLLKGSPQLVSYAIETIQLLDQPLMRGKFSIAISPYYLDAKTLSRKLVEVLKAEGYSASLNPPTGSVIILPIEQSESVIAFAGDDATLNHIQDWAIKLDVPSNNKNEQILHYYQVRNTQATDLAADIQQLMPALRTSDTGTATAEGGFSERRSIGGDMVVVDENRNGLILNITAAQWGKLLPVLRKMDRPARLVLVEVTLASVTLTDNFASGIDWLEASATLFDYDIDFQSLLAPDVGSLTARVLNNAGDVKAVLRIFDQDQRVNIMSRPHIMVKSGSEAVMEVGTEIPVVTSEVSAPDIPGATINRNIQYRKTGLLLNVTPTVHSGDRVDLQVSQEVSEATAAEGVDGNPNIFSRKVTSNMTLSNGGSVIIGGLIAESETYGNTRIPVLGDAPVIGPLFRSDTRETIRNEVLILIQAYVIGDDGQAQGASEALRERFGEANRLLGEP
ncbi:MAG: secretin N-terminal domain-containing protein [Halieaceae bacterium]